MWIGTTKAFYQSPGTAALLIIMFINFIKYGIIASLPSFSISAGILSSPTALFSWLHTENTEF
jgi:hypothetical protein